MRPYKITSGQSLIEFALILPLLLLLVMGLFDIGRAIFYYASLNTAVREGTRIAIVQPDCGYRSNPGACTGGYLESSPFFCTNVTSTTSIANKKICSEILNRFLIMGNLTSSTIRIERTVPNVGDPKIKIEIEFLFKPITPLISLIGNLTLRVNSQMLITPIGKP